MSREMMGVEGKISWFSAILIMWRGKAIGLGSNYKLKSLSVVIAVIFTIFMPVFGYFDSQNFSGRIPPETPLIKAVGIFSRHVGNIGLKQVPYIVFSTESGVEYRTENRVAPKIIDDLGGAKKPISVYVEGFVLKDGKGSFYPLKITDAHGANLVQPNELMSQLMNGRNVFYYKWVELYFAFIFFPWVISFFYAAKLRRGNGVS